MRLRSKVALVTGGGSGIGRATALVFAREGATVAVADKNEPAATEVAQEIEAAGGKAIALQVDVSRESEVQRMVRDTAAAFGRLDVLVNNAGYGIPGTVLEIDVMDWDDL